MKKNKKIIINKDFVLPEKNPEFNSDLEIEIIQLPEDEYDFIPEEEDINYNDFNMPPAPGERS